MDYGKMHIRTAGIPRRLRTREILLNITDFAAIFFRLEGIGIPR